MNPKLPSQEYQTGMTTRGSPLKRALRCAHLTLPALLVDETSSVEADQDDYNYDYQSFGASLVKSLANKMMTTMFHPTQPFMRYTLTPEDTVKLLKHFQDANKPITESQLNEILAAEERESLMGIWRDGGRTVFLEAIKHLLVAGNCCVYHPPVSTGNPRYRLYAMNEYIIRRNAQGQMRRLITKDTMYLSELPEEFYNKYAEHHTPPEDITDVTCDVYTRVIYNNKTQKYNVDASVDDISMGEQGEYTAQNLPWFPLAWTLPPRRNWATSMVEEHSGDFEALSVVAQSGLDIIAMAAFLRIFVSDSSIISVGELQESFNGDIMSGDPKDVQVLTVDKSRDMMMLDSREAKLIQRLGEAFCVTRTAIRDSERTTAEEVRVTAQELESALGGVYTQLSEDFQKPVARDALARSDLKLLGNTVTPMILTGADALARANDTNNLMALLQAYVQLQQLPPAVQARLKMDNVMADLAAGFNVTASKYIVPESEAQQAQAAQQMQQQIAQQGGTPTQPINQPATQPTTQPTQGQ